MSLSLRSARPALIPSLLGSLLILALAPAALGQWSTQSSVPTHLDVRGVAAPSADRVFIGTTDDSFDDGGALFESQDGGATWVQRDVPFSLGDPLNGLFFLDGQLGWAFGNANYRTTDGGTTWEELPFLGSTYRMEFFTPSFGFASTNGDDWVSRDGGVTWEVSPNELFDFSFADDQLGLGVAASGIYRTTDGGATFGLVQEGEAQTVTFLSSTVAVAIIDDTFWRSTDGGQTWTAGEGASERSYLVRVSDEVVLAWNTQFFPNADGQLLRSADGGQTWTDLGPVFADGTGAFAVLDDQTVVAMDSGGNVYRSTDAGQMWAQTFASPGPRPSAFSAIVPAFADAQTGYLGYGSGYVIKTTDGGATWSQISSGYGELLNDLDRFADDRLIAVGENGTVLTSDGVGRWTLRESPVNTGFSTALSAVQVLGPQEVVAVDEDGRLYRSADGGDTWTAAAATPTGLDARDLHFSTLLDGWVVGSGFSAGAIFHTTDGGDSWTAVPDIGGSLVAVDFEGESGWVVYPGERTHRTTDGGETWTQHDLPDPSGGFLSARDIDFWDENVGYVVGQFGYAARSTDGGETWDVLPIPSDEEDLTDLYLVSADELWASTNSGTVYYSATGGSNWAVLDSETDGFGSFAAIAASAAGDAWMVGFQGVIEHFAGPPPSPINQSPQALFDYSATGPSVVFTDESTDPDGTIVGHAWDFGDGATSTEANPVHVFPEAGTYTVSLTVTDDGGATGTISGTLTLQPEPGGTFGAFTEVTPLDSLFFTPQDEDYWSVTTAPADFDGDGDLDIATLGFYVAYNEGVTYLLSLMRNDGPSAENPDRWDFTYIDVPIGEMTVGSSDLAWGDVDNDGDPDLVVGSDGETRLYRNDDGVLTLLSTTLPGYYEDNFQADFDLRSITWADYDNDGDQDLLLPSVFESGFRTALMRNDGPAGEDGWTFTEIDAGFAPTRHAQSTWADVDGDQDLDLLLSNLVPNTDEGFIHLYRNDGAGGFSRETPFGDLAVERGEIQWGDYDADGDYDIFVAGDLREPDGPNDRAVRIYQNDGGTYTPLDVIDCIGCDGWFDINAGTWADYDSDGDMDILIAGTYNSGEQIDGRARVYANDGGTFTPSGSDLPAPRSGGDRGGTFSWLDIDGEGDLDYFIAGQYFVPNGNNSIEAQMHLYRNDAEGANLAPAPPTGLDATVESEGQVTLAWNASGDDSTPAAALTYDLDLRRDGVPIGTLRRIPEPGNVSAVTNWVLAGLPDGTYTWTVRAVDSAFNGSEPAEGSFTVGATTANEGEGQVPDAYALDGNYPNPFAGSTTIRYALPEQAEVELEVYDLLGRRVARLVSDERPAGVHEVRWDAAGFASGTYLVRFSAGTFTAARRLLLVQ